ncbi:NH(3)-dependent NAD(+) synthetase [Methanobrevibacter cuticularis]|uniref:NH(3)-dependent NAD(+) synthetase n=1 Tax=Methanobrevibacter cuticularis TaxID=47311 RepID=A0A166EBY8_9EURY|nr:NAD+ synthase [Methanobrevibacter cuticularis]KZX16489.1 NH(3)-dependent NAD(+) synthetase [Methanobrevibacter cuticularis]
MIKLPEIPQDKFKEEIVQFIKRIASEARVEGIVIGLSGGIDSTVVAYLLTEAIGPENVFAYHLSSSTTPLEDTEHAQLVAKLLKIQYQEIGIDEIAKKFLELSYIKTDETNVVKIAEGNLKARIRMSLLYYFANMKNCLVAGTGNRSELLIGYFTKYGDGACDFEPIGNIYKTQLRKLAKKWNIPKEIITKPPRAGLWINQKDEEEIGLSYDILDQLLYLMIDKKLSDEDIIKEINISPEEINMIRARVSNNQHKLQFPPSPSINKK